MSSLLLNTSDYIGKKFGRLTIISFEGRMSYTYRIKAICDCGIVKEYRLSCLKSGHTQSCGCISKEKITNRNTSHGLSRHPLYIIWRNIKRRCYKKTDKNYDTYGAKGIRVCDEWLNDFMVFYNWCINNGWRKGLQIDKDIKGNGLLYSPETCCLVTSSQNCRKKINNYLVEYDGEIKPLVEWSELININYMTLYNRVKNTSINSAFTKPVRKGDYRK